MAIKIANSSALAARKERNRLSSWSQSVISLQTVDITSLFSHVAAMKSYIVLSGSKRSLDFFTSCCRSEHFWASLLASACHSRHAAWELFHILLNELHERGRYLSLPPNFLFKLITMSYLVSIRRHDQVCLEGNTKVQ